MPPEKSAVPEYAEGSNLYTVQENCLLHWIETQYENVHRLQYRRIANFDKDFEDSQILSALLQAYAGNIKELDDVKTMCSTT
jgi:hypothetical protein